RQVRRHAATVWRVSRGLAYYTALDPTRPWPGIERDPRLVAGALQSMAGGGRVVRLDARLARHLSPEASAAAVVALDPCLLTTLGVRDVLDTAVRLVYPGGLVVYEEPIHPAPGGPEPLLVDDERVLLWSSDERTGHDLRIVEFTNRAAVEAIPVAPIDLGEVGRIAGLLGLEEAGAWSNWAFEPEDGRWRICALRRVT
ncbi:MAG: hypothetical protein KDB16_11110, partial [Acidimicrobiales bacterium]|nr:hypothetical protein [Acidimicrobiales bacterium]